MKQFWALFAVNTALIDFTCFRLISTRYQNEYKVIWRTIINKLTKMFPEFNLG